MRLSESMIFIPMMEPKDLAAGAYVSDAVDCGLLSSLSIVLTFGAITGNSVLTVNADTTAALATALTTPIAFKYRMGAADFKVTKADQLGEPTAVALTGLTLTAGTFDHTIVVVELDMDALGSTARYVTVNISATANPCLVAAVGIGAPRYPGHLIPTTV